MNASRLRKTLPLMAAALGFFSWVVANFYDERARDLARALSDARAESSRGMELQLLVERLADLRTLSQSATESLSCSALLSNIPRIVETDGREGALVKDEKCVAIVNLARDQCSAEDRGRELRVHTASRYAQTLERVVDQLRESNVNVMNEANVATAIKKSADTFDAAYKRFITTFGQLTTQPVSAAARNCNALTPFAANRREFLDAWAQESAHFANLIAQLPSVMQSVDERIVKASKGARRNADIAHAVALFLAGLAALLVVAEKLFRSDDKQ